MLNRNPNANMKNAQITVEVTLSIILSTVVLFLLIGLLSDNLQTMAANMGIRNLFGNKTETKTEFENWSVNPADKQVTVTQVNVQTVGDRAHTLAWYMKQSQKTIDKYINNRPVMSSSNYESQVEELAKALTEKRVGLDSLDPVDIELLNQYNIKLNSFDKNTTITFTDSTNEISSSKVLNYYNADDDKLIVVKLINNSSFK